MGILTLGLLGVASVFPVGSYYMQKAEISEARWWIRAMAIAIPSVSLKLSKFFWFFCTNIQTGWPIDRFFLVRCYSHTPVFEFR